MKYMELAADINKKTKGYDVKVIPVVIGVLGTMINLQNHLRNSGLLDEKQLTHLVSSMQRETICSTVGIIKKITVM